MKKLIFSYVLYSLLLLPSFAFATEVVEVQLEIKDHKFIPDIIKLPAGRKIIIHIHNQDETIEEFESISLKREKIILGKSKGKIILAPLKPGKYDFFGEFHQDTAKGSIIVE